MITIDRKTGKVLHADPITPEQNQILWEAIVRLRGPELLRDLDQRLKKEGPTDAATTV